MTTATAPRTRRRITTTIVAVLAVVFAVGVLASCSDDDEPSTSTTPSTTEPSSTVPSSSTPSTSAPTETTTGIANPASVFCINSGGTIEIVDEEGGQVGYCVLPDGTRIEEWNYFRQGSTTTTT